MNPDDPETAASPVDGSGVGATPAGEHDAPRQLPPPCREATPEAAFRALMDAHAPRLARLAGRLLGAMDRDDAVAIVFFRAWRALEWRKGRWYEKKSAELVRFPERWLFKAAVFYASQHVRARRRQLHACCADAGAIEAVASDDPDPARCAESSEALGAIAAEVDLLPGNQKTALRRYLEGYSQQEIAAAMDRRSRKIVNGLVRRALRRTRERLERRGLVPAAAKGPSRNALSENLPRASVALLPDSSPDAAKRAGQDVCTYAPETPPLYPAPIRDTDEN